MILSLSPFLSLPPSLSLPSSLDLDKWINDPPSESDDDVMEDEPTTNFFGISSADYHRKPFYEDETTGTPETSHKKGKGKKKGKKRRGRGDDMDDEGYPEEDEEEMEKVNKNKY